MLQQLLMPLQLHESTKLVGIDMARACLGVDEDSVMAMIDHGQLRWAWDVSVKADRIRNIRIWAQCIVAAQHHAEQPGESLSEVVSEVIGVRTRTRLRAAEVRKLLCCCEQTIARLARAGELDADLEHRTRWVTRVSLERFLSARRIA